MWPTIPPFSIEHPPFTSSAPSYIRFLQHQHDESSRRSSGSPRRLCLRPNDNFRLIDPLSYSPHDPDLDLL